MNILSLAAFLAVLAGTLWRPSKAIGILLAISPIIWAAGAADMSPTPVEGINLTVVVSGIATLVLSRFLFRPATTRPLRRLRTATLVYCVATLPSILMSDSLIQGFGGYLRLISPWVFFFAVLHLASIRGIDSFHFKAAAFGCVSLFLMIVAAHYAGQDRFSMGGFVRLRAFHLSPNNIALYSVAGCGVLLCGALAGKHRWWYVSGILLLFVCAYLTGFRTAWIGLAVLMGVALPFTVRSGFAKSVAVLLFVVLALVNSDVVIQRLTRYDQEAYGSSTARLNTITSGRITIDSIALGHYLDANPSEWIFGLGVYSSKAATQRVMGSAWIIHDDYLATLSECGIVGLAGYLFLLFTTGQYLLTFRRYILVNQSARILFIVSSATFAAFLLMSTVGALYTNVFVGWYLYGFIGLALAQLKRSPAAIEMPVHRTQIRPPVPSGMISDRLYGGTD
jgi:hypothetical protein